MRHLADAWLDRWLIRASVFAQGTGFRKEVKAGLANTYFWSRAAPHASSQVDLRGFGVALKLVKVEMSLRGEIESLINGRTASEGSVNGPPLNLG